MSANEHAYYAAQSPITDPGRHADLFDDVPQHVPALQRVARELVLHYRADDPQAHGVPDSRLAEIDSRDAVTMLDRLLALDDRPLTEGRPPHQRLVGCCRDFTVLFLSMARRAGIPARARVGFATYFVPRFQIDHEVAEVWDEGEERWRLVDAELRDDHRDPNDGARVDPLDVPRDRFLVGGAAWMACRGSEADPETFVVDPSLELEQLRGWPYLLHNLVHDLAALNRAEMVLWDVWGLMTDRSPGEDELRELDDLAAATVEPELDDVRRRYEEDARFRVPDTVMSFSPVSGPMTVASTPRR
jgi:hypothetical protein